jgi:hypothetical protein
VIPTDRIGAASRREPGGGDRPPRPVIVVAMLLYAALLLEGCSRPRTTVSNYDRSQHPQGGPWILATPNPVLAGRRGAKTMITWDTTEGFPGWVYMSVDRQPEKLLSSSSHYYVEAPVEKGHTYEFRLYGNSRTPLSTVKVTCK